ncbi:MAG: hypothetical protein R3C10_22335 [Pirellulales bacterium]
MRTIGLSSDIGAFELLSGDGNLDGVVDGLDYLNWVGYFDDGPAEDPPGLPANGDYTNDGVVDGLDYLAWAANFGVGVATVPAQLVVSTLVDEVDNDFSPGDFRSAKRSVGRMPPPD